MVGGSFAQVSITAPVGADPIRVRNGLTDSRSTAVVVLDGGDSVLRVNREIMGNIGTFFTHTESVMIPSIDNNSSAVVLVFDTKVKQGDCITITPCTDLSTSESDLIARSWCSRDSVITTRISNLNNHKSELQSVVFKWMIAR